MAINNSNSIQGSIVAVIFGFILLLISFGLLFWNEGRTNFADIAKTSVVVNPDSAADTALEGKLVSLSGNLVSGQIISDNLYIRPHNYIALKRTVEMYAWDESSTSSHSSGSSSRHKHYSYSKTWAQNPDNSSSFHDRQGHYNPAKRIPNLEVISQNIKLGKFHLTPEDFDISAYKSLELSPELIAAYSSAFKHDNKYIYEGFDPIHTPQIGDLRIYYDFVPQNINGTVFGVLSKDSIIPAANDKGEFFYKFLPYPRDKAIEELNNQHQLITWVLRGVGFLIMTIGLILLFAPVRMVLKLLPFGQSLGNTVVTALVVILSVVLSAITIVFSMLIQNFALLIGFVFILTVLIALVLSVCIFKVLRS